ncbi:death effector domain-containing protein-like [Pecten maximus]|uniref:death effector domain-containing protein-like n=1 Tax=Pecten maximus TaxID=6579 RepID=UPI00145873B4|nr:death effector domain-containing protein-like [Pecten maximus]
MKFPIKMATNSDNPSNDVDEDYISMSLHEMFHIVGDQMTERDIKLLKFFCVGLISEEMTSKVHDGFSFLLCMEKMNLVSESNFMNVLDLLRIINRHDLSQFVHLRCRKTVRRDPICEYLESNFTQSQSTTDKSKVSGGSSLVQENVASDKSVCEATRREGGKSSVKTAVSDSTTEPCQISAGSVHCKSSRTKTSDSQSSCQLASSPSSSTLTSVCSSSKSLLPGERCVQKSSSSDVPSMSTRSKRQRSGSLPENTGGSDDSPSTSIKRRRKDVETKENTEVKDHSSTDVIQVDRQSAIVAAGPSVQERMASDDSSRTNLNKSEEKMMASPSDISTSETLQPTRASSCDRRDTDCMKALDEGQTGQTDQTTNSQPGDSGANTERKKEKLTCDIRLRVRAEVALQESTLEGNVFSNKPTVVERQCEKFMQANTVLKSHDLGSIVCDIKFSDLTYLDAFWRDYINGSLLEALKGVFLTESLKQAVGHEAIKLLVNVDEDDYEAGRVKLLQNLKN